MTAPIWQASFTQAGSTNPFAQNARNTARQILGESQFHSKSGTQVNPLGNFVNRVGRFIWRDILSPIGRHIFKPIAHPFSTAFGAWWPVVVFALVFAAAALVAWLVIRRRARQGIAPTPEFGPIHGEDPDALDRAAADAEADGDFERAVRLRFRAGLVRLERGGLATTTTTRTSGQLAGSLHSPAFTELANQLDAIVYGGKEATAEDTDEARSRWPEVPQEAVGGVRRL